MARATTQVLAAAWAGLLLLRLLLLGRGALADYDERRYFQSLAAVRALAHGHWHAAAYALSMTAARPVDALWRCLPAAGQLALKHFAGWDMYTYPSLLLPTGLNWLTTVVAAGVFYRLCARLLAGVPAAPQWALVAAVLYASLANTSLYVRHVLPYDGALLLFLALLAWVLRQPATPSRWFWVGLGVGAGLLWLFYPGYYAGPVLLVAPLLDWRRPVRWAFTHVGDLLALGGGFGVPLLAAEGLSRMGGAPPFWAVSYDLSLHILQGEPAEGYTFLVKYLWQVEGPLGVLLLALLALALVQAAFWLKTTGWAALVPRTPRQKVLAAAALLFLAHATAAAVGHRIVWYGRLLHFYLPWLVLAGVAALAEVRWGWAVGLGGCAVALGAYALFFSGFYSLAYPPDVITTYGLGCLPPQQLYRYNEVRVVPNLDFPVRGATVATPVTCPLASSDSATILVNFALLYPLTVATQQPAFSFSSQQRTLFVKPYYGGFSAYLFEGLNPAERAEMMRRQFRLRLVRVPAWWAKKMPALSLGQP